MESARSLLPLTGLTSCGGDTNSQPSGELASNTDDYSQIPSSSNATPTNATGKINDTGLDRRHPYSENRYQQELVDCTADFTEDGGPIPNGQNAEYGRDAKQATNSNSNGNGRAGFSFTRLDAPGENNEGENSEQDHHQDNSPIQIATT